MLTYDCEEQWGAARWEQQPCAEGSGSQVRRETGGGAQVRRETGGGAPLRPPRGPPTHLGEAVALRLALRHA